MMKGWKLVIEPNHSLIAGLNVFLFDGDGFGQVSGFVGIEVKVEGDVVTKELGDDCLRDGGD